MLCAFNVHFHALKKLSLLHTMEWTFGLHDCPSPPPPAFQSTCSLLPMTQILYYISIFILSSPGLSFTLLMISTDFLN